MSRFYFTAHVALTLPLMCSASSQELSITPSVIEITPKIEDTLLTHAFKLTNRGGKPMPIVEFKGGCGCIGNQLKVFSLAPCASTEMTIAFEFRDSVGPRIRKIALITKAEGATEINRNVILTHGDIPAPLKFSTKALI